MSSAVKHCKGFIDGDVSLPAGALIRLENGVMGRVDAMKWADLKRAAIEKGGGYLTGNDLDLRTEQRGRHAI